MVIAGALVPPDALMPPGAACRPVLPVLRVPGTESRAVVRPAGTGAGSTHHQSARHRVYAGRSEVGTNHTAHTSKPRHCLVAVPGFVVRS